MHDIRALFVDLISQPTADKYILAWEIAMALPEYNPYGGELHHIEQLLEKGQFQAA